MSWTSRAAATAAVQCEDGDVSVSLSGKVDRVDGYIKNGRLYLRVMDYKSGKKSFSLSDIWYGLTCSLSSICTRCSRRVLTAIVPA